MKKFLGARDPNSAQAKDEALEAVDYSAAIPTGSHLPVLFTPFFTGRDELISQISEQLTAKADQPARVVIAGSAGSGKTQLAGALIRVNGSQFEGVHWIEAGKPADIPVQVAACGKAAALAERDEAFPEKLSQQIEATLKSWNARPNRLVILNHVTSPEVLEEWSSRFGAVHILATSAGPGWRAGPGVFSLPAFNLEESAALLTLICPRLSRFPAEDLARLADVLHGQPLALHIAGCYLRERSRMTVRDYLNEIEKKAGQPDPATIAWFAQDRESYTPQLAAAFQLSLRLLESRNDKEWLAWRIIYSACYLSPDIPIPTQVLIRQILNDPENLPIFNQSLSWLYALGLLVPGEYGPVMHSALSRLMPGANTEALGLLPLLADGLIGFISLPQFQSMPAWLFLPHLRAAALRAEDAKLKQAGALWNRIGALLIKLGESSEARAALEHSLAFSARLVGGERAETAAASAALGRALSDLGDLPGAVSAYERALTIYEGIYGPAYPEVANISSMLGQVLYDMGNLAKAKTCFERALTIHEAAFGFGPNHPSVIDEADYLGRITRDMNDLPEAKNYFSRALAIEETINGANHPNVATRANNLGRVLYKLGDLDGARANFERSLSILKLTHGQENPATATAMNNLGLVLQDLGSLDKSQECFEMALRTDERIYGAVHPNVARDLNNLGSVYSSLGKLAAARDCFTRALEIDQAIFGKLHPNNAINANNLGRVLYNLGDLPGAEDAFQRALDVDQHIHGLDHVRVGTDLNNLGTVIYEKGQYLVARGYFEQAMAIFQKHLEPEHAKINYARKFLDRIANKLKD